MAADTRPEVMPLRLYTDEDVTDLLARSLRGRGFDAVSAHEIDLRGISDEDQLSCATAQDRAILTFNVRDFVALHRRIMTEGGRHAGIIVATQSPFPELFRRTVRLLEASRGSDFHNRLEWLNNHR